MNHIYIHAYLYVFMYLHMDTYICIYTFSYIPDLHVASITERKEKKLAQKKEEKLFEEASRRSAASAQLVKDLYLKGMYVSLPL
jgi:hypothetical protein